MGKPTVRAPSTTALTYNMPAPSIKERLTAAQRELDRWEQRKSDFAQACEHKDFDVALNISRDFIIMAGNVHQLFYVDPLSTRKYKHDWRIDLRGLVSNLFKKRKALSETCQQGFPDLKHYFFAMDEVERAISNIIHRVLYLLEEGLDPIAVQQQIEAKKRGVELEFESNPEKWRNWKEWLTQNRPHTESFYDLPDDPKDLLRLFRKTMMGVDKE